MIRFVMHPGWITSVNDGEKHFITVEKLIAAYGVPKNECLPTVGKFDPRGVIHLSPRHLGDYAEHLKQRLEASP